MLSANETVPKLVNQPSYVYDTETALYYLHARYYDQDTARFISRDPNGGTLDNPLSQNLYAYGNADPVNNVDPDGELAEALALGGSGLAAAYGTGAALSWNPLGWAILGTAVVATAYVGYQLYQASKDKKYKQPKSNFSGKEGAKDIDDLIRILGTQNIKLTINSKIVTFPIEKIQKWAIDLIKEIDCKSIYCCDPK